MTYIPDQFGEVVARVADRYEVYYDYGHYTEVVKNLTQKDGSVTQKDQKYPLIWLVMNMEETIGKNGLAYRELSMHLILAMGTSATYTMQERRDKVFLPVLYPIYFELLEQLKRDKVFQTSNPLQHTKIDRPYWGGQDSYGNGQGNLFNDYIDAIQIKNLKVNVKNICT